MPIVSTEEAQVTTWSVNRASSSDAPQLVNFISEHSHWKVLCLQEPLGWDSSILFPLGGHTLLTSDSDFPTAIAFIIQWLPKLFSIVSLDSLLLRGSESKIDFGSLCLLTFLIDIIPLSFTMELSPRLRSSFAGFLTRYAPRTSSLDWVLTWKSQ